MKQLNIMFILWDEAITNCCLNITISHVDKCKPVNLALKMNNKLLIRKIVISIQ